MQPSQKICIIQKVLAGLRQLGVWSHPLYLNERVAHTTLTDIREVMPKCVVTVSYIVLFLTHTSHKLCTWFFLDVRRRFPNPPGVAYKDFEPSSFICLNYIHYIQSKYTTSNPNTLHPIKIHYIQCLSFNSLPTLITLITFHTKF